MHTWAKRGLQTALVTGGLLMLGTGIASADENTTGPDQPAGPLDINVGVPMQFEDNVIGTPLGEFKMPDTEIPLTTGPATKPVNEVASTADIAPVADTAKAAAEPVARTAAQQTGTEDMLRENKLTADVVVPIQICGNAIAAGGDAAVEGADCTQTHEHNQDISVDGADSGLAGNAVNLDWAVPVQIVGNAVAGGAKATTEGTATQSVTETGDVSTSGKESALSGNAIAPAGATPVQIGGNAVGGGGGNAEAEFTTTNDTTSGGWLLSDGSEGSASGNLGGVPIALPVQLNNNAASGLGGLAESDSSSAVDATAGDTRPGMEAGDGSGPIPSYLQTDGDESMLGGNTLSPQGALLASVTCNAAAGLVGNSNCGDAPEGPTSSTNDATVTSGGFASTGGDGGVVSGNQAETPLGVPVEVFANGVAGLGGLAHAAEDATTDVKAADGTYTDADNGTLSGNVVSTPFAVTEELFGNGASGLVGTASGTGHEEKLVEAGGYNGTTGNDSSGSGNVITAPVAIPIEQFGNGVSGLVGQAAGTATETKRIKSGGDSNTNDDNGSVSSNIAAIPVALPVQLFGNGVAGGAIAHGTADNDTITEAGGDLSATGVASAIAANIIQPAVSLPTQVHGNGVAGAGIASGTANNLTDSLAGGDATTTGENSSISGNGVLVPIAGSPLELFGNAVAGGALADGTSAHDLVAEAGGDTTTNGDGGSISGDVVAAELLPLVEIFGNSIAGGGIANGLATNFTEVHSGGDITTSGVEGSLSGSILDVPAAAVVEIFGNALAAAGTANAVGENSTIGTVGGVTTTAGEQTSGSGVDGQLPIGVVVKMFGVPMEVLGQATAAAPDATEILVGEEPAQINIPLDGSELPATGLPALPMGGMSPRADSPVPALPMPLRLSGFDLNPAELPGAAKEGQEGDVPALPALDSLDSLSGKSLNLL